jgi:transposase
VKVAGVDIASREHLGFFEGKTQKIVNDASSQRAFVRSLPDDAVIALEATGGYGEQLIRIAQGEGRTVYVLNPRRVKKFRESLPVRAKTDRIDAELIAEYVRLYHARLHPYLSCPEPYATLKALSRKRTLLAADRSQTALRLRSLQGLTRQAKALLASFDAILKALDKQIAVQLAKCKEAENLLSIVGVGPLGAAACLGALGHLPFKNANAFIAYAGLDLRTCDSGQKRGLKKLSNQGDRVIRKLLYLCAMSASLTPTWRGYYLRKLEQGHKRIQALVALARMLAKAAFGVYKSGKPFQEPKCSLRS